MSMFCKDIEYAVAVCYGDNMALLGGKKVYSCYEDEHDCSACDYRFKCHTDGGFFIGTVTIDVKKIWKYIFSDYEVTPLMESILGE